MKKYYEFSIASSEKKNSQKTVFFFKLEALDASTKVYIAPKKSANLSKSKNLLIDFKVHFLTAYYQDKITTVEKKMIKLDKRIVNSKSKELSVEMSELVRERNRYIQTLHAMQ